jgi:hypothetical protein
VRDAQVNWASMGQDAHCPVSRSTVILAAYAINLP